MSFILLISTGTFAVTTSGVAVILHVRILFATLMTVTAIFPVFTISKILVVGARCKLDIE